MSEEFKQESKKEEPKIKTEPPVKTTVKKEVPKYLTPNAVKVYELVSEEPIHVDEITNCCNFTIDVTLSALTELEVYGLVTQISGRRYKIN